MWFKSSNTFFTYESCIVGNVGAGFCKAAHWSDTARLKKRSKLTQQNQKYHLLFFAYVTHNATWP